MPRLWWYRGLTCATWIKCIWVGAKTACDKNFSLEVSSLQNITQSLQAQLFFVSNGSLQGGRTFYWSRTSRPQGAGGYRMMQIYSPLSYLLVQTLELRRDFEGRHSRSFLVPHILPRDNLTLLKLSWSLHTTLLYVALKRTLALGLRGWRKQRPPIALKFEKEATRKVTNCQAGK